jgi:hypothetical protein
MDTEENKPIKRIISVKTVTVETTFDELPPESSAPENNAPEENAEEKTDTLRMSGEPEPFDPYDLDKPQREAAEQAAATPTPESVAADLKAATSKGIEYDGPEEPETPAQSEPEPEKDVEPPKPKANHFKKLKQSKAVSAAFLVLITIICVAIFVIGVAMFLRSIWEAKGSDTPPEGSTAPTAVRRQNPYHRMMGIWESQAEGGSCYIFTPDKEFYWLQNCEDFSDNYYFGRIEMKNANDALVDLGISLSQARETAGSTEDKVLLDNVYSLHLLPSELKSGGEDRSDTAAELSLLFIYEDENNSRGYLYNAGDTYAFAKRTDIKVPTRRKCGQDYYDFENLENNKSCDIDSE